jgi:SAM-dependent methyltransferase
MMTDAGAVNGDGPARARWNERYRDRAVPQEPAPFVVERLPLLPRSGRGLDLAGGGGRHAVLLAAHGLDVTLVDVSDLACAAARTRARAAGVDVEVVRRPLTPGSLPPGPFAAVLAHHYLDVAVWETAAGSLAPGGVALLCQPTVRNLERHARPGRRWLLDEGRIQQLAAEWSVRYGLSVVELTEGWTPQGRHEARLMLRQRAG